MADQHLGNPLHADFLVLESLTHDGMESWPWSFEKWITQHRNCFATIFLNHLIHLQNKINWHLLPSLSTCIVNVCVLCFPFPTPLPHLAVTQESCAVYTTHSSMNFSCTAPLNMQKLNYSTWFTVGSRAYDPRHVYMLTVCSEQRDATFPVVCIQWPIEPQREKRPLIVVQNWLESGSIPAVTTARAKQHEMVVNSINVPWISTRTEP